MWGDENTATGLTEGMDVVMKGERWGAGAARALGDLAFCQTDGYLAHGEVSMAQRCQPAGAMSAPPSSPRPRASIRKLAVKEEKMVSVERLIDCVVSIHGWGDGLSLMSGCSVEYLH